MFVAIGMASLNIFSMKIRAKNRLMVTGLMFLVVSMVVILIAVIQMYPKETPPPRRSAVLPITYLVRDFLF